MTTVAPVEVEGPLESASTWMRNPAQALLDSSKPAAAGEIQRVIWALALPVLGEHALHMMVGWSETLIAGWVFGTSHYIAAIIVCAYLVWLCECSSYLISIGSQAVIARLIGAHDDRGAGQITLLSLRLAALWGLIMACLVSRYAVDVTDWLNLHGRAQELAVEFLRIFALGIPLMMLSLTGATCLRAAGYTRACLLIMIGVNVVNVVVSWSLAVGLGPFPKLGWAGIAWGATVGFSIGGLFTMGLLLYGFGRLRLPRRSPAIDPVGCWRILRIGVPGGINTLCVVGCQLWFLSIIGRLGDDATAAHGVAVRSESICFLSAEAIGVAAAALIGQALGARKKEIARQTAWIALRLAVIWLGLLGLILFFGSDVLVRLFVSSDQPAVASIGGPVLKLVAFAMPALATCIVLTAVLQGAGEIRWPMVYSIGSFLIVRIPLAYALTGWWLPMGLYGAWIAMVVDLHCRGLGALLCVRFLNWTATKV